MFTNDQSHSVNISRKFKKLFWWKCENYYWQYPLQIFLAFLENCCKFAMKATYYNNFFSCNELYGNPRPYFITTLFVTHYNFREVVRRTTVIIFTNKEDYIIASNKGGDVYRFGLWHNNIFQFCYWFELLTDMCPFDILVNWSQIIVL